MAACVQTVAAGPTADYSAFYAANAAPLRRWLGTAHFSREPERAADVAHDALTAAWAHWDTLAGIHPRARVAWLYRAAGNKAIDIHRHDAHHPGGGPPVSLTVLVASDLDGYVAEVESAGLSTGEAGDPAHVAGEREELRTLARLAADAAGGERNRRLLRAHVLGASTAEAVAELRAAGWHDTTETAAKMAMVRLRWRARVLRAAKAV